MGGHSFGYWFFVLCGYSLLFTLVGNLVCQLAKKPDHRPLRARSEFVEADDVKPERRAEIERDNAARLAITRSQCATHVYDECGTCQRCFTVREGAEHLWSLEKGGGYATCLRCKAWQRVADAGPDDAHQAFSHDAAVEHAEGGIVRSFGITASYIRSGTIDGSKITLGPTFEKTRVAFIEAGRSREGYVMGTPPELEIAGARYERIDDPETGEFLGAYVKRPTYKEGDW
jgi:hypothetical protein